MPVQPAPPSAADLLRTLVHTCVAIAVSAAVNVLLAAGASVVFDIPEAFEPFSTAAVVIATAVGAAGAGAAWTLARRFSSRPARIFVALVLIGLVASMYPPIDLLLADPPPYAGTGPAAVGTLMAMHVVVAVTSSLLLLRDPRRRS